MRMDMVERVAKALEAKLSEMTSGDDTLNYRRPSGELASAELARAAINAMREPTPEMLEAAWSDILAEDGAGTWRKMIDAALKSSTLP